MKKIVLLIILCSFILPVNAINNDDKMVIISRFARNLIFKGMSSEHIDDKGMPIIAYMRGEARIEGYNNRLFMIDKDYRGNIAINSKKWNFDCSSFVSFVFKHTINLKLLSSNYMGGNPYLVSDFLSDKKNFNEITTRDGIKMQKFLEIQDNLKAGDLIIVVDKHIAMYIGNNELAEASMSSIGEYNANYTSYRGDGKYNLGFSITPMQRFLETKKNDRFVVLRIKDEILNNVSNINTTIIWPDANKEENLVGDSKTDIDIKLSSENYVSKLILNISLKDSDGITSYKIVRNNEANDYTKIDKINEYKLEYEINDNGLYNIYIKDALGNETMKSIEITNIDNELPTINNLYYKGGYIYLDASDTKSGLDSNPYSFDDCKTWGSINKYHVQKTGKYYVCVKDKLGNIKKESIDVDKVSKRNIYLYCIVGVSIVFFMAIIIYRKKSGDMHV